jgi:DNA invertase Pin-like site-specific DNA recombinase
MTGRAVAYYRVSTDLQAREGFSLDGQRTAVRRYVDEEGLELLAEYSEAESGYRPSKVTLEKRPGLQNALRDCKRNKARLVIAALDRLARNVVFIASLVETRIPFVALDIPDATPFMIHIYAAVAEEESRQRSQIIRDAQIIAKARGKRWDQRCRKLAAEARARSEALRPVIDEIRAGGIYDVYPTMRELRRRNVPHFRGTPWYGSLVLQILQHLGYYEKPNMPWPLLNPIRARQRAEALRSHLVELQVAQSHTDRETALILNERGLRTATGQLWTRHTVCDLWRRYLRHGGAAALDASAGGPTTQALATRRRARRKRKDHMQR